VKIIGMIIIFAVLLTVTASAVLESPDYLKVLLYPENGESIALAIWLNNTTGLWNVMQGDDYGVSMLYPDASGIVRIPIPN
jgi:hypothetical protein